MGGCGLAGGGGGPTRGGGGGVRRVSSTGRLSRAFFMHWNLDPFRCLAFMLSEDMRISQ